MFVSSASLYSQVTIKIPKIPKREKPQGWRKEFYDKWKFPAATVAKFDTQFDALAAEAPPRITAYTNNQVNKFALRNAVEERMMRSKMNDVPGPVVHKIGLYQSTWNIEKNDLTPAAEHTAQAMQNTWNAILQPVPESEL